MIVQFPTAEALPQEIADLRERHAALDTQTSCIVEAPAGSGKTGLLIQRYLKLLAAVDDPAEVLALTFTTKATAEMAERVLKALRSASVATEAPITEFELLTHRLAEAVLERDRERSWRILDRPHLLNIRTIDSLCALIVQALPVTAGGMPTVKPVADPRPLYQQAAHAVMMRFGGGDAVLDAAIEIVLLHRDGDLPFCERVLAEMLATRDQWGSLIPLGERLTEEHLENITLPRLNASLRRTIEATLAEACEGFEDSTLDEIARIAERHAFEPGYKDDPNPLLPCAGRQSRPGNTVDDLPHWLALARLMLTAEGFRASFSVNHVGTKLWKDDAARLREILSEISCDELFRRVNAVRSFAPDATYPEDQWRVSKALFRLLEHALVELKLLFAREEVCDFTEVALSARAALQTQDTGLLEVFGTCLRHLLVDEMQDTSAGQYDLLEQLTAGWDGRSQTVFLVGDPKQSIYLFRQARVDRFQ
ncbi:MAG TPA: UvrD-helicase domain-containing protein, partial [Terriglobus sp.]